LRFEQPTHFEIGRQPELVSNPKSAKTLDLAISPLVLARARRGDEVIEMTAIQVRAGSKALSTRRFGAG